MNGIQIQKFGEPEVLKLVKDLPIPEPNDNQIQIRNHAAGINPVEAHIRAGAFRANNTLPFTPGLDSAGVITKLGKNVQGFQLGDRVFTCITDTGTYAEYCLSSPNNTFKLPENLNFEEGSAIGVPYFSAYRALFSKANAQPGETVLVHGASGSCGLAVVQLARVTGLRVIGTAGSAAGLKLVEKEGASLVLNHRDSNYVESIRKFAPGGVDIIIEMLASSNLQSDLTILRPGVGRVVVIGSKGNIEINPGLFMQNEVSVTGILLFRSTKEDFKLMYNHLYSLFKHGVIKPVLNGRYSLDQAPKAHTELLNNTGALGRLSFTIP